MDTLPLDPIDLVAIDRSRNIRRRWSVVASIELFGHVIVESRWDRIGTPGCALVYSFTDADPALRYICALLARRGTARRRLGVNYRFSAYQLSKT